ncbi:MAG: Na+/H+ antiporter [Chitinophagaceae bacterium]|nr:Na+/H+ antiporter [Chitinophagaceae bacterium]
MIEQFSFYLGMVVLIVLVIMLANRIKVAYPILLVLVGLGICFIPGTPKIKIDPELIFIFFLPPLLYEASWNVSWKDMWRWRRIISSFAFPVVFLTAFSVALVANYFIPGFSLALGFLLGGIVSPPDAVSASAILRFVKIPKHLAAILEGESLLNDASSLIIFRFAMIAVATGQFLWYDAVGDFFWMIIAGTGIGLLVGYIFMKAHKLLPTDVNMDIILTLVAPYIMYIAAEEAQASGVLAVVSGGLFLSYYRHRFLSGASRLRAENVWQSLVFLLNGLVFLLIGLDLPQIIDGLHQEGTSFGEASRYAILITGVLIFGRMLVAYSTVVFTSVAGRFIPVAEKSPGWKAPLVMGWTGMRGVVSLAAALSIPVTMSDGSEFPQRNLILFITFGVILLTLVIQGLTLPVLIRKNETPTV